MTDQQLRQNKITGEWVIYSPARGSRPKDTGKEVSEQPALPELDPACPFCPGNEDQLPEILTAWDHPDGKDWQVRAVPNKYPAVTPEGNSIRQQEGIYLTMSGHGHHEVIIESPRHNHSVASMAREEIELILAAYQQRFNQHRRNQEVKIILPFRNHGPKAGTSLRHPHSQLMAINVVPSYVRFREDQARHYHDDWGRCIHCDLLKEESASGDRVFFENEGFLSFVPYFAETPFEIWLLPRKHRSNYGDISPPELSHLAVSLQDTLSRLDEELHDPDYNYVIHTSSHPQIEFPYHHWFLEIQPRITARAGFEIGSGMRVNPSLPEEDADRLRSSL